MNTSAKNPDLDLHNGRFTTLNRANPTANAVAIKDGLPAGRSDMSTHAQGNPHWIAALLAQRWLPLVARAALVSGYVIGGVAKLANFHAAVLEQEHL